MLLTFDTGTTHTGACQLAAPAAERMERLADARRALAQHPGQAVRRPVHDARALNGPLLTASQ